MNKEIDKNIKTSSTSKVMELDNLTDNFESNLVLENFGKKKKKKKPTFDLEDIERVMTNNNEMSLDNEETTTIDNADNVVDISLDIDFSMAKKKRKPKKNQKTELIDLLMDKVADDDDDDEEDFGDKNKENEQQHGSNLNGQEETANIDYTYEELLKRAFDMMLQYNPDMAAGRRAKFVMRPPHVIRIGTKKTSFVNFIDIAKTLHRVPKHLLDFVLAELGTSGSMDGTMQLIIKGRFQAKQIENVLRRYIKEYVTCHTCRSPDTLLQKETRLYFLKCETCGSRCSVASIKSGFQAVTSKRAAIRAKTN